MQFNVILAGVGGQGILTIAQALSLVATRRGWHVKQAEVHGMSQRGGAVQSHLRMSDEPIYSDLIPLGRADLILSVEPLEALRYVQYLDKHAALVSSTAPFVNIPDYPAVEGVLARVALYAQHVLIDAERLARAAGSARAVNTVMLGAASVLLGFEPAELDAAIAEMFGRKGPSVVEVNRRACRLGRSAARAYRDALDRGLSPEEVRRWIESIPTEQLAKDDGLDARAIAAATNMAELSSAETQAICQTLQQAYDEGRPQLFEHEVYRIVELVGAISPPRHYFLQVGEQATEEHLASLPGRKVVLKIVSPDVVHKSEADAIAFLPKNTDLVRRRMREMIDRHTAAGARVVGVLLVEYVERGEPGFGQELFVGIRATREFGAILAAGLGGIDTEYLAHHMKPGLAVAKVLAEDTTPEGFFELFQKTAAYEVLAGRARGHRRVVSDGELLRCFRGFLALARRFCTDRGPEGPDLRELEVNPFAFVRQRMVPLDGRGQLGPATHTPPARPLEKIHTLYEPRSMAVLGVSARRANFGRILLDNVRECGFPAEHLYVIKPGTPEMDGVRCVPDLASLPERVDLLVIASGAQDTRALMEEVIVRQAASSVILIPGGLGEREGTESAERDLRRIIQASRSHPGHGPLVLGPNCLGVRSRPGAYDTFFIPPSKLDARRTAPPRRVALVSQSGAFMISRMSNLELLDPMLAVSLGNQIDLTVSDVLRTIADREDIDCIGTYVEGFNDMDGLAFVRAVESATQAGRIVIFYKAGRTEPGRAATAGHTASVAGDYDICQTAVANAGAVVVDTFKEFEQLLELATALHGKTVGGRRIAVISNAGFETVGMADAILGARYRLEMPSLGEPTARRVTAALERHKLAALVNVRNPLDLTPMAGEEAYEACAEALLDDPAVDALVVSVVPLTPQLLTTEEEIARGGSLVERLAKILEKSAKPIIAVIDSGAPYDAMARGLWSRGVPVFRTCDQAVRSLGRYLCHRAERAPAADEPPRTSVAPAPIPPVEAPV